MDRNWYDRFAPWIGFVMIAAIIMGGVLLWQRNAAVPAIRITAGSSDGDMVKVDVKGAVVTPGVYELSVTARIEDAISAAGGLTGDADMDLFTMSRASTVTDGQLIRIPSRSSTALPADGPSADAVLSGSCINLNSATTGELDSLPGIGVSRANSIITNRPYAALTELIVKKVLTQSIYDGLADKICI